MKFLTTRKLQIAVLAILGLASAQQPSNSTDIGAPSLPNASSAPSVPGAPNIPSAPNSGVSPSNITAMKAPPSKLPVIMYIMICANALLTQLYVRPILTMVYVM
ncbi:uncharacterized protein EV154DRAFT_33737 [Mucor mucedo]|uniref:uncharacterized protein n=1 Tax=Mucor mucedo TaxID=29922 RepID=UPI0022212152|nr:uncharacterized protein EV154DRAFT_33737 [Mucor mucedo]KAI7895108.1 hypothetical protein EV154DRAFT_33737 [Mucor mucedo]